MNERHFLCGNELVKSSVAKHYGWKCAGHCSLIANRPSQSIQEFSCTRKVNCCFACYVAIIQYPQAANQVQCNAGVMVFRFHNVLVWKIPHSQKFCYAIKKPLIWNLIVSGNGILGKLTNTFGWKSAGILLVDILVLIIYNGLESIRIEYGPPLLTN